MGRKFPVHGLCSYIIVEFSTVNFNVQVSLCDPIAFDVVFSGRLNLGGGGAGTGKETEEPLPRQHDK